MSSAERLHRIVNRLGVILLPIAFPVMASGLLLLAYQCILWVQDGRWTAMPIGAQLHWLVGPSPRFAWAAAQRVSDAVMGLPTSLVLFVVPLLILWPFASWSGRAEKHAHQARAAEQLPQPPGEAAP